MKIKYFLTFILLCIFFPVYAGNIPDFPMSLYGEIKIGDFNLPSGVVRIYNNSNLLVEYEIIDSGKYGAFNVFETPLIFNAFEGNLSVSIKYDGDTYSVSNKQIQKITAGNNCPPSSNIIFVSQNCRYDIFLTKKEKESSGGGGGGYIEINPDKNIEEENNNEPLIEETSQEDKEMSKSIENIIEKKLEVLKKATKKSVEVEMNEAFKFLKEKKITTTNSLDQFEPESKLIRMHLAKMISQFAIEVLGKTEQTGANVQGCEEFEDMKGETEEMQKYSIMACKLGLMGRESDQITVSKNFNPNVEINRAQFGTILSRLIRGQKYAAKEGETYYNIHLNALKEFGIISIIDPDMEELRGRVMLMLYRIGG